MSTTVRTQKLTAIRQEMDTALEQEIAEVNRRGGGKKHSAINGQLVRTENGRYIYAFTLEDAWDVADDTLVQIESSGKDVNANIVSVAGQSIKIAADWEIPARDLARITLKDDPTAILTALRKALAEAQDGPNELAAKTFGLQDIRQTQPVASQQIPGFPERGKQRVALSATQTNEVTYVVGPPGTGKTTTLAAIAYQFMVGEMSVLIAANTNIAVDNAIERLADLCAAAPARPELQAGRIIRYGTPQLERVAMRDDVTMKGVVGRRSSEMRRRVQALCDQRSERHGALEQWQSQYQQSTRRHNEERQQTEYAAREERAQMQTFQTREQNRKSVLDGKRRVAESVYQAAYQRVQESQAHLSRLTRQRDDHRSQLANIGSQVTTLRTTIEAARKANAIARFFKGQNLKQMYEQLSRLEQQEWQTQQNMAATETRLNQARHAHAGLEQNAAASYEGLAVADSASRAASSDAEALQVSQGRVARLEAAIREYGATLNQLERQYKPHITTFERAIADLDRQIGEEEKRLRDLENDCVRNALVVATTLSKTAMAPAIRDRRFDVVIIDEASMAALPAVYVAAAHADQRVVIVGDPEQLAPIVQSKQSLAERWLGRDIFAQAKVTLDDAARDWKHSVLLDTQHRMRPEISRVANTRIYRSLLKDGPEVASNPMLIEPVADKALLLCDTSAAHPVCTHERGGMSRFNMYHALCDFTLACQALRSLPLRPVEFEGVRVGIITPYRRQARILQILIKEAHLEEEMMASTVHRFQGLECDVVIFDTVESNIAKSFRATKGKDATRMVNVAITRARKKLIVVANVGFLSEHFGTSDTILQVARDALDSSAIDASTIVPVGTAEIASKQAHSGLPFGNALSTIHAEHYDERTYFAQLYKDFEEAQSRIIILSAWVTDNRVSDLIHYLQRASERGVKVTVISRPSSDKNVSRRALDRLHEVGTKLETWNDTMHEKAVFIDANVVYYGSLNTLSSDGRLTETMTRFDSIPLSNFYSQHLGIHQQRQHAERQSLRLQPDRSGSEISIPLALFPRHLCPTGLENHALVAKRRGDNKHWCLYGCTQFKKDKSGCRKTLDITEQDARQVSAHMDIICDQCGKPLILHFESGQDFSSGKAWMVCDDSETCGFHRLVTFT